jgi:hypothetical protein
MPMIKLDSVAIGDIIDSDIVINEVVLFEAGTLITSQRLDILKSLNVRGISIVDRSARKTVSLDDIFENIDRRFSYVSAIPVMAEMKGYIKDILGNQDGDN